MCTEYFVLHYPADFLYWKSLLLSAYGSSVYMDKKGSVTQGFRKLKKGVSPCSESNVLCQDLHYNCLSCW